MRDLDSMIALDRSVEQNLISSGAGMLVLHVEDDDHWVRVVEDIVVRRLPRGVEYRRFEGSVAEAITQAGVSSVRNVVLLVDLRLSDRRSQISSLQAILTKYEYLVARSVGVMVLSAQIHEDVLSLLEMRFGESSVFRKQSFDEDLFVDALSGLHGNCLEQHSGDPPVYSVAARAELVPEGRFNIASYSMHLLVKVIVTPGEGLAHQSNLCGRGLVCYLHAANFVVDETTKVLSLPGADDGPAVLTFRLWRSLRTRSVDVVRVLGFHRNHQLFVIDIPVAF